VSWGFLQKPKHQEAEAVPSVKGLGGKGDVEGDEKERERERKREKKGARGRRRRKNLSSD
jgi:hypothetical protein